MSPKKVRAAPAMGCSMLEIKGLNQFYGGSHTLWDMHLPHGPQRDGKTTQLTVEENLRIGLAVRRPKLRAVPEHLYQMFPVLKQMLRRRGGDLSGGQQQQLAIARELVHAHLTV